MEYDGGLDFEAINSRLVSGVTTNADKTLSNQVQKWLGYAGYGLLYKR